MVATILILGLIFRLLLSFLPPFAIDFGGWIAWGERLVEGGVANFYSKEVWTNYLPGYLYILWFLGLIRNFTQIPADSKLYEIILKLPANLADLATGFLIFKIVKNYANKNLALLAASLYIFNPATSFNSAVWGQVDSVFTFFLIAAFYLITEVKKTVAASSSLALSLIIKPQAVALIPVFIFRQLQDLGLKKTGIAAFLALVLIFLISAPFFAKNPIFGLPALFAQMSADYPYTSLFAFNFWWIFGGWENDATGFLFSNQIWGVILWLISQIMILGFLLKNKGKEDFYLAATISLLAFFVLPTRVHERYLFPFFAFGAVTASIFGRIFWLIWGVLTLIHFANLYFVYSHYNPNFLKFEPVFQLIGNLSTIFAIITVGIFSLTLGLIFTKKWQKN